MRDYTVSGYRLGAHAGISFLAEELRCVAETLADKWVSHDMDDPRYYNIKWMEQYA